MQYLSNVAVYLILLLIFIFSARKKKASDRYWSALFYIYICAVLTLTVLPVPFQHGIRLTTSAHLNLVPFIDIKNGNGGAYRGVILNVIMFLPLGFFIAMLHRKSRWFVAIPVMFLASLLIESIQLSYWFIFSSSARIFDVTDLITNTTGGIVGYMIGKAICFILRKTEKRRN